MCYELNYSNKQSVNFNTILNIPSYLNTIFLFIIIY